MVHAALEQEAIDGQENLLNVSLSNTFSEVQKILQDAAAEASKFQRQTSRDAASGTLASLKQAGMQVIEFSAAEQNKLRERFKPVIDKHRLAIAETMSAMQAELAKLRK